MTVEDEGRLVDRELNRDSNIVQDEKKFEHDVFLIYAGKDEDIVRKIHKGLSEDLKPGLQCAAQFDPRTFPTGRPVMASISKLINTSHRTALVLTQHALESPWINLETILAIEQSQHRQDNDLTLRLLLVNIEESEVKRLKRGQFKTIPHIPVDLNDVNWQEQPIQVHDILPVGSLAHGLVFSHFNGFLSYVIKHLPGGLERHPMYKEFSEHFCRKYNMLVPLSCKTLNSLEGTDENTGITIEKDGDSIEFKVNHMGKERTMSITVYKISKGNEFYFFFADMPQVLNCIYQLWDLGVSGVDCLLQVERFKHTYNKVVNHADFSLEGYDTFRMLDYDDKTTTHFEKLFESVKKSVADDNRARKEVKKSGKPWVRQESDQVTEGVLVSCVEDSVEDRKVAEQIVEYLEEKKVKVALGSQCVGSLSQIANSYKWYVFVFSEDAMRSHSLTFNCIQLLGNSVSDNEVKVIPVLNNISIEELPTFVRWVTLLTTSDKNYCEHLYDTIRGGPVTMEERMPAGDVATGLCWAYLVNYLKYTLFTLAVVEDGERRLKLDFVRRIRKFLKDRNIRNGCLDKVCILCPASCETPNEIAEEANEGATNGQGRLEKVGQLLPVFANTGGHIDRVFSLYVYKYHNEKTQKTVYFVTEVCTPFGCLHQMASKFPFAGLTAEDKVRQGEKFVNTYREITSLQAVKEKFGDFEKYTTLLYYKEPTTLMTVIEETLLEETGFIYKELVRRDSDPDIPLRSVAEPETSTV
ncbi:hypothetical protein MAR_010777 [Mya arenaria]|uniref:TIR domain-containing protein n=1 Tax=Mya arenaria TaxID=6604 RepID=A0ABY7FW37_MYAAR|nr:hypothetical protein MAR_010777 [Mya arenaria]